MATPQDDTFDLLVLDTKWTFVQTSPGATGSFSLASNAGNFTLSIPSDADYTPGYDLSRAVSLGQAEGSPEYFIEAGLTTSGVVFNGHESGIFIQEDGDTTKWIALVKRVSGGAQEVRAIYMNAGAIVNDVSVGFIDDTNIVLKIRRYDGNITFFYHSEGDPESQVALTVPDPFTTTRIGLFGVTQGAAGFDSLVNYFNAKSLSDIEVNGDVLLRVIANIEVNADTLLVVKNYSPAGDFSVKQHFETPTNTITWTNPSDVGYIETIIIRKTGGFPKDETDGTVILTTNSLETFDDGPIPSRSRQYYAAFAVYADKTTFPSTGSTMPIFINIYRNSTKRFSRAFKSGPWAMFYSLSKFIQDMVDVDIVDGFRQFNIKTASGSFLDLWGKLFGSRRFGEESDLEFAQRTIRLVLLGKTVPEVIREEVLRIPGVVFCEILDATSGSMFIGYSFIGFAGTVEDPEQSDFITPIFYDNPFFFTVRVRIKQGTNLDQIIKTVQDTKAAGTRFTVEILEILP